MTIQQRLSPGRYRVTVADYLRLDQAGAFGDARTELIEGEIWIMSPAFTRHAKLQSRLDYALRSALLTAGSPLEVYAAASIRLSIDSMPEPDLVVADDHDDGPLPVEKVRLVVEISVSSLADDLGRKARLYAQEGVAEYWVVDVESATIHQMWMPASGGYADNRSTPIGERMAAATIEGVTLRLPSL